MRFLALFFLLYGRFVYADIALGNCLSLLEAYQIKINGGGTVFVHAGNSLIQTYPGSTKIEIYSESGMTTVDGQVCMSTRDNNLFKEVAKILTQHTADWQMFGRRNQSISLSDDKVQMIADICGNVNNAEVKTAVGALRRFRGLRASSPASEALSLMVNPWSGRPALEDARPADANSTPLVDPFPKRGSGQP